MCFRQSSKLQHRVSYHYCSCSAKNLNLYERLDIIILGSEGAKSTKMFTGKDGNPKLRVSVLYIFFIYKKEKFDTRRLYS